MYTLGVDLGTVYTAAATWADGHAEIFPLGNRAAAIPSVVLLRDDDEFLVGEAASRRALLEPLRVAREFKRRLGDATPILLGGSPQSPQGLMARLLRSVITEVTSRQGEPPSALCLCHPANWGPFKTDLLRQAVRMADVTAPITFAVEPVAAAAYYARQQRVDSGSLVAVYDLGGGTFDAAVVRKTGDGSFEIVGQPEGIEHLGGADFDAAVFAHVRSVVGEALSDLDDESPVLLAALQRLREECTAAKETLSSDTDVSIPVLLPDLTTEVRLTRTELERMIRPALHDTIGSLQRAVRSAGITAEELHSVLLIGGSSRIPLVAQLVGAELNRPVAVDAHPKHAVALGAALLAAGGEQTVPTNAVAVPAPVDVPAPVAAPAPVAVPAPVVAEGGPVPEPAAEGAEAGSVPPRRSGRSRPLLLAAASAIAVVVVGGGVLLALEPFGASPSAGPTNTAATGSAAPSPSGSAAASEKPTDPLSACPTEAEAARRSCLTSAERREGTVVFTVQSSFLPTAAQDERHFHLHLYLANPGPDGTTVPSDTSADVGENMGTWYNLYLDGTDERLDRAELGGRKQKQDPARYSLLCVRVANGLHGLERDGWGGTRTGNCLPLT